MDQVISCREAVLHLWDYLDRGLPEDSRRAVEDHLATCVQCCGERRFAEELRRVLRTKTTAELPDEIRLRLDRIIDHLGPSGGTEAFT